MFIPFQSKDVPQGTTPLKTLGGEEITVFRNPQTVTVTSSAGSATVVTFDIPATNGVIHVIDSVI
jgi:transforming growth factor-beta-induced protein